MLVFVVILMNTGIVYAAKGGKPPKDEDPAPEPTSGVEITLVDTIPDSVEVGSSIEFTLKASDKHENNYEWSSSSDSLTQISSVEKKTSVTTAFSYVANQTETVTVTYLNMTNQATGTFEFTISVLAANTEPVVTWIKDLSIDEDATSGVLIATVQDDGQELFVSSTTENASISFDGQDVFYIPIENYHGSDTFDLSVSDNQYTVTESVTVTVNPINDEPIITAIDSFSVQVEESYNFTIDISDVDMTTHEPIIATTNGSVVEVENGYNYTSSEVGDDIITIEVTDGDFTVTKDIYVTVNDINHPPVVTGDYVLNTDEDTPATLTLDISDPESDEISIEVTQPSYGTVTFTDYTFIYTPNLDYNVLLDDDMFKIIVSDGFNTVEHIVTLNVSPINDLPLITDDYFSGNLGEQLSINVAEILVNDTDVDSQSFEVVEVNGQVFNEAVIIVDLDVEGTKEITYKVSDGQAVSLQGTIIIEVNKASTMFTYLSLGDSIPAGVSYENSSDDLDVKSYADWIDGDLSDNGYDTYTFIDQAKSGYTVKNVYDDVYNESNWAAIESADLITLCIGANDIMNAAPRKPIKLFSITLGEYIDFYDVNWAEATAGLNTFEDYWDDIIKRIYTINPDVNLIVLNMYNPYSTIDEQRNSVDHPLYGNAKMHHIISNYFYNSLDDMNGDERLDYGLNYVIENPSLVYESFVYTYDVINVYQYFEDNYSEKMDVIAFYDNFKVMGTHIADPHPTAYGHEVLFGLFHSMY